VPHWVAAHDRNDSSLKIVARADQLFLACTSDAIKAEGLPQQPFVISQSTSERELYRELYLERIAHTLAEEAVEVEQSWRH
jgi:hypothetical protein